jgi:indolepyruvate ferredoxin oxidoreductase
VARLDSGNADQVLELASLPEHIRGFGHVKEASLAKVLERWDAIEAALAAPRAATAGTDASLRAA